MLAESRRKCPHCLTVVRLEVEKVLNCNTNNTHMWEGLVAFTIIRRGEKSVRVQYAKCPSCLKVVILLEAGSWVARGSAPSELDVKEEFFAWPLHGARPVPAEVEKQSPEIASDYREAGLVLNFSPKASAALSRRCLQAILRKKGVANQKNLSDQIDAVIPNLPSHLSDSIDAIRSQGNFAAHPIKNEASGQIVDVEPGEADWNLDVLDMLFDFYYVQPAKIKEKRDALNRKLKGANKPPMK